MSTQKYPYIVPRSFRLRQELEFAEKGHVESKSSNQARDPNAGWISFGLGEMEESASYDNQLSNWNGTIIGPQSTNLGDRIYSLRIKCGPRYPDEPPTIHFVNKINMPGVDPTTGQVSQAQLMKGWTRHHSMYDYLAAIRAAMVPASKIKQPSPEEKY